MHKLRVYEMTTHPVAREMIGYLLVRGGVQALSYALALETLTGVDVKKMLPIPMDCTMRCGKIPGKDRWIGVIVMAWSLWYDGGDGMMDSGLRSFSEAGIVKNRENK